MENLDVYFVNNKDNKEEKTYNGMTENREKAIEFMEQNEVLTNLKNEKWYSVEDDITALIDSLTNKREKTFNDFYKEFNLDNGYDKLNKFRLYALCRYEIQDTEFDDKFIDELYNFYEYLNENHYSHDLDLDTYISILSGCVEKLKIDLRDIDLDELAKEFED